MCTRLTIISIAGTSLLAYVVAKPLNQLRGNLSNSIEHCNLLKITSYFDRISDPNSMQKRQSKYKVSFLHPI